MNALLLIQIMGKFFNRYFNYQKQIWILVKNIYLVFINIDNRKSFYLQSYLYFLVG